MNRRFVSYYIIQQCFLFLCFDFYFFSSFVETNVAYYSWHDTKVKNLECSFFSGSMNKQWTNTVVDYCEWGPSSTGAFRALSVAPKSEWLYMRTASSCYCPSQTHAYAHTNTQWLSWSSLSTELMAVPGYDTRRLTQWRNTLNQQERLLICHGNLTTGLYCISQKKVLSSRILVVPGWKLWKPFQSFCWFWSPQVMGKVREVSIFLHSVSLCLLSLKFSKCLKHIEVLYT